MKILLQADFLETEFGISILEELTGESLTEKNQKTRLFDQTTNSTDVFYPAGRNGKPAIHNHSTGEHWFPLNAYAHRHGLSWKEAVDELSKRFLTDDITADITRRASEQQQQEKTVKPQQLPSLHNPNEVALSTNPDFYKKIALPVTYVGYLARGLPMNCCSASTWVPHTGITGEQFSGSRI